MADVTKLLEQDHREVEDLFAKAQSTSGAAKQQIVTKIASELTLHAQVEEDVVYPAMRDAGLGSLVQEAEEEHQKVKDLVARLESMDGSTADVDPVLGELESNVEHHVQEEESEAFPKFRSAVDDSVLQKLADRVEAAKKEAQSG